MFDSSQVEVFLYEYETAGRDIRIKNKYIA